MLRMVRKTTDTSSNKAISACPSSTWRHHRRGPCAAVNCPLSIPATKRAVSNIRDICPVDRVAAASFCRSSPQVPHWHARAAAGAVNSLDDAVTSCEHVIVCTRVAMAHLTDSSCNGVCTLTLNRGCKSHALLGFPHSRRSRAPTRHTLILATFTAHAAHVDTLPIAIVSRLDLKCFLPIANTVHWACTAPASPPRRAHAPSAPSWCCPRWHS